ncbi:MAG: cytochrome P450 [Steroidobacteraceae bacterium]|jgi:cytochrome P450|nr:cytochrome P450 [Steroidobacteraceae bacterium]
MSEFRITNFEQADKALRNNNLRQALYDEGAVLMEKVLVNLHGDEHRARRLVESLVFRRDFFKYYEQEVFPPTLAQTIEPFVAQGRADLVDFGYRVLLNLTADFAGIDRPEKSTDETTALLQMNRTFGQAAVLGQTTRDKEVVRAEIRAALAAFDERFFTPSRRRREELLARHARGEIAEDALPRDILLVLLQHNDELKLSHDVLLKEIAFYLLAGAFTSIHSMTHSMHELLDWLERHPEDRARVKSDPFFLQRCIHESMRLHPSAPVATRKPVCPVHLPAGDAASEDDKVLIDLIAANTDPNVYGPDAAEYNPHRELGKGRPSYGLSFGLGMHACLGRNLAAGVNPMPDTDPATHQYGTVTLICRALVEAGARIDPNDAPRKDTTNTRPNWGYYPVLLGPVAAERVA